MHCASFEMGTSIALYEFSPMEEPEMKTFESHLSGCRKCTEELDQMQKIWTALEANPDLILNPEKYLPKLWSPWADIQWRRPLAMASGALVLILTFGLNSDQARLMRLGAVESTTNQAVVVRGANQVQDPSGYASQLERGVSAISEAEGRFWGLGRTDKEKLDEGIGHLKEAARLAVGMENQAYLAESYLYLSKAHLMKQDAHEASIYLERILKLDQASIQLLKIKREASALLAKVREIKS